MFTHYRTQGIFLKKEDRGEADQLFTIYTKDYGKLEILGKAIRKIKSKLRSGAELFYFSEIEFIQGKAQKTLTDAILIDKFENIRKDLERLGICHQISEVLDALVKGQERDEKIWQLLIETFKRLEDYELKSKKISSFPPFARLRLARAIENLKLEIIYYYFLWNLLSLLGFKPELFFCPICRKKLLAETFYFMPKEGGIVCWRCLKELSPEEKERAKEIKVDTVKILRVFLSKNWEILSRLKITKAERKNLKEVSEFYLAFLKEA